MNYSSRSLRFLECLIDEEIRSLLFDEVGKMATNGNEVARLYWMALAKLTGESDEGRKKTPTEIHNEVVKLVKEVYKEIENKNREYKLVGGE